MVLLPIVLPTAAAGTAEEAYVVLPYKARVVSAKLVPHTTAALNGTNYATVGLAANDGAGGSFAAIATSLTTETVALTVGVQRSFTLTNTPILAANSIVRVAKTVAGTGAVADCTVVLELEKVL